MVAGPFNSDNFYLSGSPTGVLRSNLSRHLATGNLAALTTQVMTSTAIVLQAGDVVTNLTFMSATTALATGTNWWFALYSGAATPALIAQTADQTSTAWAANTVQTVALATPYTVQVTGLFYAACMVKAATTPTLAGISVVNAANAGAVITGERVLAQTSGSSLTATAPATITSGTTVATIPLVIVT